MQTSLPTRCDIFCRVIDNYGDIGVCWRLARQLSEEHDWQVRLWVDDITLAANLCPDARLQAGIEVRLWTAAFPTVEPAEVVIEAFACDLPPDYLNAMAKMPTPPVWLNLEYLCVEDWGAAFHTQPSPHPQLPLNKHFFVPGPLPGCGGLILERNFTARRGAFDRRAARQRLAGTDDGRWVFMFCYDNPALPLLLQSWAEGESTTHCLLSAGKSHTQATHWLGRALPAGTQARIGNLLLHALPFVPQAEFDELLWTCDINFVRGEDSFCRAQWAGQPFIWQIYPQQDAIHHAKLAAFHRHFSPPTPIWLQFSDLWNGVVTPTYPKLSAAWQALEASLPALNAYGEVWRTHLQQRGNLAGNLLDLCQKLRIGTLSG